MKTLIFNFLSLIIFGSFLISCSDSGEGKDEKSPTQSEEVNTKTLQTNHKVNNEKKTDKNKVVVSTDGAVSPNFDETNGLHLL